jgi:hypothetical protein
MDDFFSDLLVWQPPDNLQRLWAEHLHKILTKHKNGTRPGWLRNLIHPSERRTGQLTNVEKIIIKNLHNVLKSIIGLDGATVLISNIWGVSKRTIYRCIYMPAKGEISLQRNSPERARKRNGEQRTDKCKQQVTFATPQKILDLKAHNDSNNPRFHNQDFEEAAVPLNKFTQVEKVSLTNSTPTAPAATVLGNQDTKTEKALTVNKITQAEKASLIKFKQTKVTQTDKASLNKFTQTDKASLSKFTQTDKATKFTQTDKGLLTKFTQTEKTSLTKFTQVDKVKVKISPYTDKVLKTQGTQTEKELKTLPEKRNRRKTFLKIQKKTATIKIALKKFDHESIMPAFKTNYMELEDRAIQRSAEKLESLIAIISDNNPDTAAKAMVRVLTTERYILVQKLFESQYIPVIQKIVLGIKSFISDHSNLPKGGLRQTVEQNAIDAVIFATVWGLDKEERVGREVSKAIGVRIDTVAESIHAVYKMKEAGERFKPKQRKIRSDNVQQAAHMYIQRWQHSDESTRIDTNTWKVQKSINPFTNEEQWCSRRIWSVVGAERQLQLFRDSKEYEEFKTITSATVGLTMFKKYLCPCTKAPTAQSCVDPLISGVQHLMAATKEGLSRLPDTSKVVLASIPGYINFLDALKKGRAVEMVEACCCSREEQHMLKVSNTIPSPRLLRFACCNGICSSCGLEKRFGTILHHPFVKYSELQLSVQVWEGAQRQGEKNGIQNMQLELTSKEMSLRSIVELFKQEYSKCSPHIFKIEWMNAMRSIDISSVGPNNIIVMTDFSATLDLKACETVNSSVDSHAFLDNFVVVSNCRKANVIQKINGEDVVTEVSLNDCDVHQFFGSTMSKGKKNDYVSHNACLKHIIKRYIHEFQECGKTLTNAIVWTDNCPNQYKCKENFVHLFDIEEKLGIKIAHCFAVKDNFKGVWDGAGKVVKNFLWRMEQEQTRSATAFECFINMKHGDFEFDDRESWKRFEETNDKYLLQHSTFTNTRRIIGLVVDIEEQYEQYSSAFPGNIVLADRREIPTLTKPVKNTTKLHQVSFCQKDHGASFGYFNVEDYPCRCILCRNKIFDPVGADGCPYKTITNSLRKQKAHITFKKEKNQVFNGENFNINEVVGNDRNLGIP